MGNIARVVSADRAPEGWALILDTPEDFGQTVSLRLLYTPQDVFPKEPNVLPCVCALDTLVDAWVEADGYAPGEWPVKVCRKCQQIRNISLVPPPSGR